MNVLPDISKVGPFQAPSVMDQAAPKSPPLLPTTVIKPAELISAELVCKRDTNAPEFIISGVIKVTAGDGGAGGSEVIEIPLPMSIPGPKFIGI
jgi:hypothetical protein